MRIAHVVWSLEVGGIETLIADIANQQSRTCQVAVVVINDRFDELVLKALSPAVQVILIRRPAGTSDVRYWLKLNYQLARFRPDVIHAHQESIVHVLGMQWARKVLTVHATNTRISKAIHRYRRVFSISAAVQADLQQRAPACRPVVVRNGIDCAAVRLKTSYGFKPLRMVQVGRLAHEEKGQDILLQALRRVHDHVGEGAATVDFIGNGQSLPYLRSLVGELRLERWCTFAPARPRAQIYESLSEYDLLVQPSRSEGFGLTIAEALAARLPVLVADVDGPMEIIGGGEHGCHFRAGDDRDCADAIMRIMSEADSPDLRAKLDRARAHVVGTYDISTTATAYLREYRNILA